MTEKSAVDFGWMGLLAFQLGVANAVSRGSWHSGALVLLLVTFVAAGVRFGARSNLVASASAPEVAPASRRPLVPLVHHGMLGLLLGLGVTTLLKSQFLGGTAPASALVKGARIASLVLLASYHPRLDPRRASLRHARFVLFAIVVAVTGVVVIRTDPKPPIDVWTIQTRGVEVLLEGRNPYVFATVPDTDPENDFTVPYVYPPTVLYAGLLGSLLGDVRYAMLAAVLVAGVAIRAIARVPSGNTPALFEDAPALFFWQTPILALLLELGWVDPIVLVFLCLGVASWVAGGRCASLVAPILFGLAISAKQSMFWLVPLIGLLLRLDRRSWLLMGAAALAPVLPFLVWDARALRQACFELLASLPPRHDALNLTNGLFRWFRIQMPAPGAIASLLTLLVVGLASRRVLRTKEKEKEKAFRTGPLAWFAESTVFAYFVFFFFNRWAFANYYFFLTGLAALAAATVVRESSVASS